MLPGYRCTACKYRTVNRKNMLGHPRTSVHLDVGSGWEEVMLQSFSQGRYTKYWIVDVAKIPGRQTDAIIDRTTGNRYSDIGGRRNGDRDRDKANKEGGGAGRGWDGMLAQYGRALKVDRQGGLGEGLSGIRSQADLPARVGTEIKAVWKSIRDGPEREEQETLARLAKTFGREM
ncbi:hypothetical protein BGZ61DRAFT_481181 [Ilyonectria robusta]|uniref:uncharacterized protein n=1 Tax=Ilyonectria robusta TaxID=1079257 RepID=UPI001E8EB841|nr:uncharacterized protein BGZ61DRAFT_481181 [Ilyonectria robusta]KAH8680493.1 hypothetical protein BGZ61DRAFT_481181 [Ilyonectria robusta]